MEEEDLYRSVAEADAFLEDEEDRAPTHPPAVRRRQQESGGISAEDLASLRKKFTFLSEFSDAFIRSQRTGDLLKMESTAIKIKLLERSTDHDDKLASNRMELENNVVKLGAAEDNRWTKLHPARFLPGMACSTKKMWVMAREELGLVGGRPVGCYDMGSVGMGGFVTNRGWCELANPGSSKISLRMFSINNCGSKMSSGKVGRGDRDHEMEDILELGEFKVALRALRVAASFVAPWNFSFIALENFLIQCNFCNSDLAGIDRQAQILTQFVDYVLGENANKWRDGEPFLDSSALRGHWESFFAARPQSGLATKNRQKDTSSSGQKQKSGQKRTWVDICFEWNVGKCPKSATDCKTWRGTPLRHVCNHIADRSKPNVYCEKAHTRQGNH